MFEFFSQNIHMNFNKIALTNDWQNNLDKQNKGRNKIMSKVQKPARSNIPSKKPSPIIELPPDPTANLNPKQKITYFLTNIQQKIIHEIDEQKQPVSVEQSPFFEDEHTRTLKKNQQKLKKLTQQRKLTQQKYKELAQQEFQLKHDYKMKLKQHYLDRKGNESRQKQSRTYLYLDKTNNKTERLNDQASNNGSQNEFIHLKPPQSSNSLKAISSLYKLRPKSQLTKDDIKTLKNLKSQYKKFQQQISLKTIQHYESLEKIRKENIQFQEMMKKEKNEVKKKQIQLKLQDLERQKQERIKKFQQDKIKLTEVKKKPKRFQKLMKEFESREKMFEEKKVEQMKLRLRKKMQDMSEISEHEKRYQQIREEQLREIEEKYLQNTRMLKESRLQPQHKSRFYKSVLEQEKQRKLTFKKKQLATIQRCERIKSYAAKVYEEHAPRLKSRQNEQESDTKSQTKQDRSLSVEQRQKLGNNYLKQVIEYLKQQQHKKHSSASSQNSTHKSSNLPPISSLSTKYKDYLSEQRAKQGSPEQQEQKREKREKLKYNNSIQQVKKIMNQDFVNNNKKKRYETIDKIKEITDRLDIGQNQNNYIDKIRAKLQILQTIT